MEADFSYPSLIFLTLLKDTDEKEDYIREIEVEVIEPAIEHYSCERSFYFSIGMLCMNLINIELVASRARVIPKKMAFTRTLFGVFRALRNHKTGVIFLGVGASAIGMGTTVGYSFALARENPRTLNVSQFMAEPLTEVDTLENSMDDMKSRMEIMILGVQGDICKKLEEIEGGKFHVDRWLRKEGGGGVSCVLQDGKEISFCEA